MGLVALSRRTMLAAMLATAAFAPGTASALTEEERGVLLEISARLSAVETMDGEFVQYNPDGQQLQGKFYIARPGRVRFQYDPPTTVQVNRNFSTAAREGLRMMTYTYLPTSGEPFTTDEGNYILDCALKAIEHPELLDECLQLLPGVVETGLFLGLADIAYIAGPDGVTTLEAQWGEEGDA